MPHIIFEQSSNLLNIPPIQDVLAAIHQAMVDTGHYKLADIKSRYVLHNQFRIGDGLPESGFIHVQVAIMPRPDDVRAMTSALILDIIKEKYAKTLEAQPCSITVEIRQLDPTCYQKFISSPFEK
jgi:5-carboxymethyl-2-hydroxymuconate isomerase